MTLLCVKISPIWNHPEPTFYHMPCPGNIMHRDLLHNTWAKAELVQWQGLTFKIQRKGKQENGHKPTIPTLQLCSHWFCWFDFFSKGLGAHCRTQCELLSWAPESSTLARQGTDVLSCFIIWLRCFWYQRKQFSYRFISIPEMPLCHKGVGVFCLKPRNVFL